MKNKPIDFSLLKKLLITIVIITAVFSIFYYGINYLEKNNEDTNSKQDNLITINEPNKKNNFGMTDSVNLLVIEDPECNNCQVDLYVTQIKNNLISNLEVQKIDYTNPRVQNLLNKLDPNFLPLYLFSSNIEERDDWEFTLKNAFEGEIDYQNESYKIMSPYVLSSKKLNKEISLHNNTIIFGNQSAEVTFYYFGDYECPFCAIGEGNLEYLEQFRKNKPEYQPTIPNLISEFIESGEVKIVYINYYKDNEFSKKAHLAAMCANEQDKWREFSKTLYLEQQEWTSKLVRREFFMDYADELNIRNEQFEDCYDSEKYSEQLEFENSIAPSIGIKVTPTYVIEDFVIEGAEDYRVTRVIIEDKLKG